MHFAQLYTDEVLLQLPKAHNTPTLFNTVYLLPTLPSLPESAGTKASHAETHKYYTY